MFSVPILGRAPNFWCSIIKRTQIPISLCGKVSRRSAEGARKSCGEIKENISIVKHKSVENHRSGRRVARESEAQLVDHRVKEKSFERKLWRFNSPTTE